MFKPKKSINPPMIPKPISPVRWKKPSDGTIKVNVDAAWANNCEGFGVLARDSDGFVIGGCMRFKKNMVSNTWAEMEAVRVGCLWVMDKNADNIILEGDCANAINRLNNNKEDITILRHYTTNIRKLVAHLHKFSFKWSARSSNKVVDRLSEIALRNQCNISFNMDFLCEIHGVVFHVSF